MYNRGWQVLDGSRRPLTCGAWAASSAADSPQIDRDPRPAHGAADVTSRRRRPPARGSSSTHSLTRPPTLRRDMSTSALLLLLALCAAAAAEQVTFRNCNEKGLDDVGISRNCTIHQVNVHPCREAATGKPCKMVKGRAASISFTYTPDESADELVGVASWKGSLMNAKFEGMDTNGCHYTTCPVTAGTPGNYSFNLVLGRRIPTREYDVMWKLWNKGDELKFECCFLVTIKIGGGHPSG